MTKSMAGVPFLEMPCYDSSPMKSFGDLLSYYLEKAEISQNNLAESTGTNQSTISKVCKNMRSPPLGHAEKWADFLRLSPKKRAEFLQLALERQIADRTRTAPHYFDVAEELRRRTVLLSRLLTELKKCSEQLPKNVIMLVEELQDRL
jgi:transcriptional regulator with XRE-family HTH domain